MNVEESDRDICTTVTDFAIILNLASSISMTYPDDFILSRLDDENSGDNRCDTDNIGIYIVHIYLQIEGIL